jgi:hypothetical protein
MSPIASWESVPWGLPDTSPTPFSARTAAISTATWLPYPVAVCASYGQPGDGDKIPNKACLVCA